MFAEVLREVIRAWLQTSDEQIHGHSERVKRVEESRGMPALLVNHTGFFGRLGSLRMTRDVVCKHALVNSD